MLFRRGLSRHAVPVHHSVRVYVTFVHSVQTNKHLYKLLKQLNLI